MGLKIETWAKAMAKGKWDVMLLFGFIQWVIFFIGITLVEIIVKKGEQQYFDDLLFLLIMCFFGAISMTIFTHIYFKKKINGSS